MIAAGEYHTIVAGQMSTCCTDTDADGVVGGSDLGALLSQWGACVAAPCLSDFDSDGIVDGADLGILLSGWGDCPR
jgi:hypothetical protein